jgi:hypothetical protein
MERFETGSSDNNDARVVVENLRRIVYGHKGI